MASVTALHPSLGTTTTVPLGQTRLTTVPSTNDPVPRGATRTSINFFEAPKDGSVPYNLIDGEKIGKAPRNYGDIEAEISVQDARNRESEFSLDKNAFQLLQNYPHNPAIDWKDEESIKTHYYPEVKALLLKEAGAKRVLIFDHTIRRPEANAHRGPVTRAHIDQTGKSAKQRVEFHLPDESEELVKGRYRIINVWRPLNGKVESSPLAFADSSSVPDDDIVPVEHRYPDRTGETAGIKHNPDQKWWYWSGIDNDERILLQCYDSQNPQTRVPHSAFVDARSGPGAKGRESIEVRTLVFG